MTGGTDGVIGFSKEDFVDLFLRREPSRIGVAEGPVGLDAVLVEIEGEGCARHSARSCAQRVGK